MCNQDIPITIVARSLKLSQLTEDCEKITNEKVRINI